MKTTETIATVTTTDADNNKTVVKTITPENKTPDGSTGVIVGDEDGNILSQSTTISKEAEEKALENNSAIQSPLLVEPWTESKPTK